MRIRSSRCSAVVGSGRNLYNLTSHDFLALSLQSRARPEQGIELAFVAAIQKRSG
jgi:hypothetical protein